MENHNFHHFFFLFAFLKMFRDANEGKNLKVGVANERAMNKEEAKRIQKKKKNK